MTSKLAGVLERHEAAILSDWLAQQAADAKSRGKTFQEGEHRQHSSALLKAIREALASGAEANVFTAAWENVREILSGISRGRARQGHTPIETATFVFSLKRPLFDRLRGEYSNDAAGLAEETWAINEILDQLGLITFDAFSKGREEVISRQQQEMLELSTPVIQIWDGILALPLIGTLDSGRTQVVMESLLQQIVQTGSTIAIIDITGVPTVDTLVAQYLLKTIAAARLMGADCIVSGVRPQIAQTIVHLGVELGDVSTRATLADAFRIALSQQGKTVTKVNPGKAAVR
ncbi:MAG TPA: STAS domain-containing protein [Bryobacteraceae bacterium]|jgi:rsbT co-antagonist protein RsbR|nr:STAS domain-containing protein [Bryobacteraceae bacterium]